MEGSSQTQQTQETTQPENAQKRKGSPSLFIGIAIALIVLVGGFLLTKNQREQITDTTNQGTQTKIEGQEENMMTEEETMEENSMKEDPMEGDSMMEETTSIEVEGGAYYFDSNEIRVKRGVPVKIIFTNAGGTHDFVIDELDVKTKLTQTGETVEVEFTPTTFGEYEYFCSVSNHKSLGMTGVLIVE